MMQPRKICVFLGSRANYSSIKSLLRSIRSRPDLELQIIAGASALLDRYGSVIKLIKKDGFSVSESVHMLVEGETPATMAQSTGVGLLCLPPVLERLKPDVAVTVGDRFETMAFTLAAAYMNILVAHTMGGEVSGTIDESIRHAVTKFAHLHFPASAGARERIIRLGENPAHVHLVGCPRIDLVAEILRKNSSLADEPSMTQGVGDKIQLGKPYVIVSQHSVTSEYGAGELQITNTLEAVKKTGLQAVVLWPNADAGSEDISRGIRKWREKKFDAGMHFFKNLPIDVYVRLMAGAKCLVGNSSSGIREGAYIGTPVVNVGTRQQARERSHNVIDTDYEMESIHSALVRQISRGRYPVDPIYGDGQAGERIAAILAEGVLPSSQKLICY